MRSSFIAGQREVREDIFPQGNFRSGEALSEVRVAIVDDDQLYSTAILHAFSKKPGYRFCSFQSGEDCVRHFKEFDPDIVVLDYQLNDGGAKNSRVMNGLEIVEQLKATKPDVEVFMLSARGNMAVEVDSILYGVSDYIVKDNDGLNRLRELVDRAADRMRERHLKTKEHHRILFLGGMIIILIAVSFLYDRFLDGQNALAALLLFAVLAVFGFVYWRTVKKKQLKKPGANRMKDKEVEHLAERS